MNHKKSMAIEHNDELPLRALIYIFFAAKLIRLYSGSELVFFVLLANTFFPPPSWLVKILKIAETVEIIHVRHIGDQVFFVSPARVSFLAFCF